MRSTVTAAALSLALSIAASAAPCVSGSTIAELSTCAFGTITVSNGPNSWTLSNFGADNITATGYPAGTNGASASAYIVVSWAPFTVGNQFGFSVTFSAAPNAPANLLAAASDQQSAFNTFYTATASNAPSNVTRYGTFITGYVANDPTTGDVPPSIRVNKGIIDNGSTFSNLQADQTILFRNPVSIGGITQPDFSVVDGYQINSGENGASNSATSYTNYFLPADTPAVTFTKQFGAASINQGSTTTLAFNISNNTGASASVGFSDTLTAGLVAVVPTTNTCGGAVDGLGQVIGLTGATLAANSSCTVTVTVRGDDPAVYNNTATGTDALQGINPSASLTVVAVPLTFTKQFGASAIPLGSTTTLEFTMTNPRASSVAISFSDTLTAGIVAVVPTTNTCGGTVDGLGQVIGLAGATLAANSSCTVTVTVRGDTVGVYHNTATGGDALTGLNPSASLTVAAPPTISKVITAETLLVGQTTSMTLTLTNPNPFTLTGVSLTDAFPAGLIPSNPGGSCLPAATILGQTLSISGVTLDPDPDQFHQCTITATVTAASAGIWTNTTGAPSATGPVAVTGVPSNPDTVTVLAPPSTTKSFYPASIPTSGYSKLTIKIHNPDDFVMNNVAFTDAMPASLIIVTPTDVTNSCGGTVTAAAGTSSVSLSGGSIVAIGDCSITVTVQGTAPGSWVNTTSNVTATVNAIALTGKPASATLQVGEAPNAYFVRYASNLPVGDAVVNITNVGIGSSLPGIPGAQNGNICANVYTYSPDEQLVSCCSCLVTPNGLNSLSVNGDLTVNTLTPIRPSAVVIKLVASTPVSGTCNPATVTRTGSANFLASGLAAWGTTLHALPVTAGTPAGTYGITETPFTDSTLSNAELTRMTQLCGFIQANGSGYGICRSCKIGGLGAAKK